jgi:ADP-heptose:LPS heptosyltransferase
VVVISCNEANNLPRLLASLNGVADEVVIFDSGSTDGTVEWAREAGARVFQCAWEGWSKTKNKANLEARGRWTLSLDADEALTPESAASILQHIQGPLKDDAGAWRVGEINRLTNYCGHWVKHSGWYPDRKLRLWPTGIATWKGAIHEEIEVRGHSTISQIQGDVAHHSYPMPADHLRQIERFGHVWAEDQHARGRTTSLGQVVVKVAAQWIKSFVIKAGFLDGATGWTISRRSAWATWRKHALLRQILKPTAPALKKVLISRTDALGDLVVTLPMVSALKAAHPGVQVDVLVRGYALPVANCAQNVDKAFEWTSEMALDPKGKGAASLAAENYDAVVFAFPDKAALQAGKAAKIPIRVASGRRWHTLTRVQHRIWDSRQHSGGHEAWHGLRMLIPLGIDAEYPFRSDVNLTAPNPDPVVNQILEQTHPLPVLLHPGSNGSAGNWSATSFASLAKRIAESGQAVAFTGTEREQIEFEKHCPSHPLIHDLGGRLNLNQLLALQSAAGLVVASSTGPLHTAAALGVPTLGLYGCHAPEWAERWAPLGPFVHVLRAENTTNQGQLDLAVDEVFKASMAALSGAKRTA